MPAASRGRRRTRRPRLATVQSYLVANSRPPGPASCSTSPSRRSSPPTRATSRCCTRCSTSTPATACSTSPAPRAARRTPASSAARSSSRSDRRAARRERRARRAGAADRQGAGGVPSRPTQALAGAPAIVAVSPMLAGRIDYEPGAAGAARRAHPAHAAGIRDQVRGRLPDALLAPPASAATPTATGRRSASDTTTRHLGASPASCSGSSSAPTPGRSAPSPAQPRRHVLTSFVRLFGSAPASRTS